MENKKEDKEFKNASKKHYKKKKKKEKKELSSISLKEKRIVYLDGEIDDEKAKEIIELLLRMDLLEHKDITMFINSGGGSVVSGMAIYDTMNYIKSDVKTICTGMCASMASILLLNGAKGKRYALPNSEVMIHEVSSYNSGKITEMQNKLEHSKKLNKKIIDIIVSKTNMTSQQVKTNIVNRDKWLTPNQALRYGFVDKILN